MSGDPAFIAVLLVSLVVTIGFLVYFIAIERHVMRKITKLQRLEGAINYHFQCTCGWQGWREFVHQPVSMTCPRCNGVAVQLDYRQREL